jgi:hypothetical protein
LNIKRKHSPFKETQRQSHQLSITQGVHYVFVLTKKVVTNQEATDPIVYSNTAQDSQDSLLFEMTTIAFAFHLWEFHTSYPETTFLSKDFPSSSGKYHDYMIKSSWFLNISEYTKVVT